MEPNLSEPRHTIARLLRRSEAHAGLAEDVDALVDPADVVVVAGADADGVAGLRTEHGGRQVRVLVGHHQGPLGEHHRREADREGTRQEASKSHATRVAPRRDLPVEPAATTSGHVPRPTRVDIYDTLS